MGKPSVGAEGMFQLFEAHPDLLPVAEGVNAINYRERTLERAEGRFPCVHCGKPGMMCFLAVHKTGGYYWIDLCAECHVWVREALQRIKDDPFAGS